MGHSLDGRARPTSGTSASGQDTHDMLPTRQLAQVNVARLRHPLDHPAMEGFVSRLDEINVLAEAAPGFVWRHIGEAGYEQGGAFDDDVVVNLSVWQSLAHLRDYVYHTAHRELVAERRRWFEPLQPYFAAWHVPAGHRPDLQEAKGMLEHVPAAGIMGIEALRGR